MPDHPRAQAPASRRPAAHHAYPHRRRAVVAGRVVGPHEDQVPAPPRVADERQLTRSPFTDRRSLPSTRPGCGPRRCCPRPSRARQRDGAPARCALGRGSAPTAALCPPPAPGGRSWQAMEDRWASCRSALAARGHRRRDGRGGRRVSGGVEGRDPVGVGRPGGHGVVVVAGGGDRGQQRAVAIDAVAGHADVVGRCRPGERDAGIRRARLHRVGRARRRGVRRRAGEDVDARGALPAECTTIETFRP